MTNRLSDLYPEFANRLGLGEKPAPKAEAEPEPDPVDAYLVDRLMQHVDAEVARRRALAVPPIEVRPAYRSDGALEVRVSMGKPAFLRDSDPGDETT